MSLTTIEKRDRDLVDLVLDEDKLIAALKDVLLKAAHTENYAHRCPTYIGGEIYDLLERAIDLRIQREMAIDFDRVAGGE